MSDDFTVVIPARYESTRLPGKPLIDLCGKPMIVRSWECVCRDVPAERVIVATDDDRIEAACREHGIENIERTSTECRTGTDRVAEVAIRYPDRRRWVVAMGDNPLLPSGVIQPIVNGLVEGVAAVIGRCSGMSRADALNKTTHKLVVDVNGWYMYSSRDPIPYRWGDNYVEQVNVYAMWADTLARFATFSTGPNEQAESLEILRLAEHGVRVKTVEVPKSGPHVDVLADIATVRALMGWIDPLPGSEDDFLRYD